MNTINLNVHSVSEISITRKKQKTGGMSYEIIEIFFSGEEGIRSDIILFSGWNEAIKVTKNNLKTK